MYKIFVQREHNSIAEVTRTVDLGVAQLAFGYYVEEGYTWVLMNEQIHRQPDIWMTIKSTPAVTKGG
jgi:hypothetical protein